VNVGLFTDALPHLTLTEVLKWCGEREIAAVELGLGGYSNAPHADLSNLLSERSARDKLIRETADAGIAVAALNVSGNPIHPDGRVAARDDSALRGAVELAELLGVSRVVAMSGCPGGPGGGGWPVFAGGAWLPDMVGLWEWQIAERIEPYWRTFSGWAAAVAPTVSICLELHPGTSIYNAESYHRLRQVTGSNILVNLDPSHFWWQGIDPLQAIDDLAGSIGYAHGKDTLLQPKAIARHGVLDFRWPSAASGTPWHFAAVGTAHSTDDWRELLSALRSAGYDDVVSIEHEDPRYEPEAGIQSSNEGLRAAIAAGAE